MSLRVVPCTVKAAQAYCLAYHRHLPRVQGGLFAVGAADELQLRGVGIAGNPARVWQGTGRIAITRCVTDGCPNACSLIYGALCRAARALGYSEAWTYTLQEEPGTSLRAAGFLEAGTSRGGDWGREGRGRAAAVCSGPKTRWVRHLGKSLFSACPQLRGLP